MEVDGRTIAVSDYRGLDGESSGLKLRGCFTVDPADFEGLPLAEAPVPITPPDWFDCFDVVELTHDVESGVDRWVDSSSSKIRKAYAERSNTFNNYFKESFVKCGSDTLEIRADQPYVTELMKFFKKRM